MLYVLRVCADGTFVSFVFVLLQTACLPPQTTRKSLAAAEFYNRWPNRASRFANAYERLGRLCKTLEHASSILSALDDDDDDDDDASPVPENEKLSSSCFFFFFFCLSLKVLFLFSPRKYSFCSSFVLSTTLRAVYSQQEIHSVFKP